MSLTWLDPRFDAAATVITIGLIAYLVLVEPFLGRWMYRRLVERVDHEPGARQRFYAVTLAVEWTWALLVFAVIIVAPGVRAGDLGIAVPFGEHAAAASGAALYLAVIVVGTGLLLRRRAGQGRRVPGQQAFSALLPRTRRDRQLALGVAITAGVCEELLCRGLLIAAGVGLGGLSAYWAAGVAVAVFGFAHLYQGWTGVLGAAVIGVIMTGLYFASGSLLLPIVVHATIDIRALLLVPTPAAETG